MVNSNDGRAASGNVWSDDLIGYSWWLHAQESMNWLWTDQIKTDTPTPAIRSDVFTMAISELKLPSRALGGGFVWINMIYDYVRKPF